MRITPSPSRSVAIRGAAWMAASLGFLRHGWRREPPAAPATAPGYRLYAIGDIHGRLDLLRELLTMIERDNAARSSRRIVTVLVGDLIDRGSGAATLLSALAEATPVGLVCLLGNHEAALVDAYDGDYDALRLWLAHGGDRTLVGFGVDPDTLTHACDTELLALVRAHVPPHCITWLRSLPLTYTNGDYFFAHAGVRPGRRLSRQRRRDLLWIRDEFLRDDRWHGKLVVHGHTPTVAVDIRPNRIGIDTGAYATGRLSAIGLEDDRRWVLATGAGEDGEE